MANKGNTGKKDGPTTPENLGTLLALLNINQVYYIDDENNLHDIAFELITAEINKIFGKNKEEELKAIELEGWDRNLPLEGVRDSLQVLWPSISFERKLKLHKELLSISNGDVIPSDFKRNEKVKEQFPQSIDVKVLSPQEWESEKINLQNKHGNNNRALGLFDEELIHAGERFVNTKGQDLIVEIKKMGLSDVIICTLLTHKTTSQEELNYRNSIIEHRKQENKDELHKNEFFPLAKDRLDIPEVFADGIKKTLLNKYVEVIKDKTLNIIKQSYQEATKKLENLDIYDFEKAILWASQDEGAWEPETIIRISDIIYENELKRKMVETDYILAINPSLKESQKFLDISFSIPQNAQPYSDKLKLRHYEIYDSGEIINPLRKPLENGDIFEFNGNKYILVAQPCDMMVRKSGERHGRVATLLKINREYPVKDYNDKLRKKGHYLKEKHPLYYFKLGTDDVGLADFTDYLVVDMDYLELCVFNEKGECKIAFDNPSDKRYLSNAYEIRLNNLVERIKSDYNRLSKINKLIQVKTRNAFSRKINKLLPRFNKKNIILRTNYKAQLKVIEKELYPKFILASTDNTQDSISMQPHGGFDFGFKRVAKYKDYGAAYLLDRYTRHLSRIAEPHDFARPSKQTVTS